MRYKLEIEYEAPLLGEHNYSEIILKKNVEKTVTEYLNQLDDFRRRSLVNLYNVKTSILKINP